MTELKETIASLQKRLNQKNRELLDKDKLITELKAKHFELENELKVKMKDTDRLNEGKIDYLNKKVTSLLKEVAVLSRNTKRGNNAVTIAKDSGGSGTDSPSTN